jgi:hypothetical protein
LAKGDCIALFRAADLEIIRVGRADREEEAWWRYGEEFLGRRARARRASRIGKFIDLGAMLAITGVPLWRLSDSREWIERARRRHFGRHVWRGSSTCSGCGHDLSYLLFDERGDIVIEPDNTSFPALWYSCPQCGDAMESGHRFTGLAAQHILRRVLAYENFSGGDEVVVADAMTWIEECGSVAETIQYAAARHLAISHFPRTRSLALEIALTTQVESELMTLEVQSLEARWRGEEEIAAIVDRELTPP